MLTDADDARVVRVIHAMELTDAMKSQSRRGDPERVDEHDFSRLDKWARGLKLEDGRPLNAAQRREHALARRVGRPRKPPEQKARRCMISMDPALHSAAVKFSRAAKTSLAGLIADALAKRIKFKARNGKAARP